MKIVFDLDGVIRDLNGYISKKTNSPYPTTWDHMYNGESIYDIINKDMSILEESPPTGYKSIILNHFPHPEIWTNQPFKWRVLTSAWISKHLGSGCNVKFMGLDEKENELRNDKECILIEDCPLYKSYERIILINRPYNKCVKGALRIFGADSLDNILNLVKNL